MAAGAGRLSAGSQEAGRGVGVLFGGRGVLDLGLLAGLLAVLPGDRTEVVRVERVQDEVLRFRPQPGTPVRARAGP